jgi:NTP pyrophosphatase (non-canonical NTP hydrolase)
VDWVSLTLRDAQHLCWKNFRKINDKLAPERGKRWTPFVTVVDLLEESGNVAGAIKSIESFEPTEKQKEREVMAKELSRLLYTVFVLAEHYSIDLEESFMQTMDDYMLKSIG